MAVQGIKMIASAEEPAVAAGPSSVPVRDDDVSDDGVVDPPPTSEGEGRNHEGAVLGDEEVDDLSDEYYFSTDDEDDDDDTDDDDFDSDSEFEEDDEVPTTKVIKNDGVAATAECMFLGQYAQMATVQSTVCFMSLAPSSAPPCSLCQRHHGGGGGGEIIVDYTYTRFLRTQSGGDDDGVDIHMFGPKQARLRFILPSDPVTSVSSSLRFVGAMLASLVYPVRFSAQLQALWSASVTTTVPELVPARTTCLLVTVNVGILRPDDYTPARVRRMCAALESMARQRAALRTTPVLDIAAELHLPALLRSEDDVRPTKRRRITGEDCPICFEVLQEGLAAWPRCSHIFHGRCLEQHLLRGDQECPLCRSDLKLSSAPPPCRK